MNFKKYILIVVLLSSILSCRPKPIDIHVDSAPSKMVVFSHIIPNHFMIIALTKSFSPLEGNTSDSLSKIVVSGAFVKLEIDTMTYNFYEFSPGLYISYTPGFETNSLYKLTAIHENDTIYSSTRMLSKVGFTSILPEIDKQKNQVYLNAAFDDEPSLSNWFLINVYKKVAGNGNTGGFDIVNFFANGENQLIGSYIISDKEFSGSYSTKYKLDNVTPQDSIVATLSNINQDYYNYLGYRVKTTSVFSQLNLEPINYPTNIINGYGFFNTQIPDVHYFDLKKF